MEVIVVIVLAALLCVLIGATLGGAYAEMKCKKCYYRKGYFAAKEKGENE